MVKRRKHSVVGKDTTSGNPIDGVLRHEGQRSDGADGRALVQALPRPEVTGKQRFVNRKFLKNPAAFEMLQFSFFYSKLLNCFCDLLAYKLSAS